jgi:hypothetical protein
MTSGRRTKANRREAFVHPVKIPTDPVSRTHSWRERIEKGKVQIRPTQLAVNHYGLRDLGWAPRSRYFTLTGKLRKVAQS